MLLLRDSLSIWDWGGRVKLNISELVQDYRAGMLLSFVVASYSSAEALSGLGYSNFHPFD